MTVVQQVLNKPESGQLWTNGKVTVKLVGAGFTSGGQVLDEVWQLSDPTSALVSFDLTPTDTMTPAGCYYIWTNPGGDSYAIDVPSTGGPYTVQQCLISNPAQPQNPPGASQADITAAIAGLSGVYVGVPPAGTTAGDIPVVQSDGSVAWEANTASGTVYDGGMVA